MISQLKKFIIYFSILLFTGNCVEHKISISVEPDGSFNYYHHSTGDKDDLLDNDYPLPNNNLWNIANNFEIETDNYYYQFERLFNPNNEFPISFYEGDSLNKEILLNHYINVEYSTNFIYEYYNLDVIYKGRNSKSKYNILSDFLIDQENPPKDWVHDGLSYIFNQSILDANFGFNIENIVSGAIKNWLDKIKQDYDNDSLQEHFESIKQEGINIIEAHLIDNSIDNFINILTKYEQEARITIDLSDDVIEFLAVLPGILQNTNADSIFNDTLLWRFSANDFADQDIEITANSLFYHKSRYYWTLTFLMVFVTFVTLYFLARSVPDPTNFSK